MASRMTGKNFMADLDGTSEFVCRTRVGRNNSSAMALAIVLMLTIVTTSLATRKAPVA